MAIKYPNIQVLSDGDPLNTKVMYWQDHNTPIDITSVISHAEWRHKAGEAPECLLVVPLPVLMAAAPQVRTVIQIADDPPSSGCPACAHPPGDYAAPPHALGCQYS